MPPLRRCLRYAHRHRLWARAASVPTPLCRACHSVHAGGCDQGVSWMVLALASGRTAPTPRRLRLGSLRNGAECGGGTVAVEPRQRWQLLCGRIGPRLTQAALCACAGFACLRAAPTPATPMPWPQTAASQLPPYFLGPQNDTRHEYAKCSTSDAAEHASLLKLLSKLPPRIRRLTLRWDAMDM